MATRFSSCDAARRRTPDPFPAVRWLDEKGAPLLLAAIVAVVTLAAAELAPARSADGPSARTLTAE